MTVYIATLGYDEKFIVRFLLRRMIKGSDKILLIAPKGFREDEKAFNAYTNIKALIQSTVNALDIYEIDYSSRDSTNEINKLKKFLETYAMGEEEIWVCLSGGMRIIIIYTLLAMKRMAMDTPKRIWIEVDFENLTGSVVFPLTSFILPKDNRIISILNILEDTRGKTSLRKISGMTGISLATVHRLVKKMKYMGLVDDMLRITTLGRAYLGLYKD